MTKVFSVISRDRDNGNAGKFSIASTHRFSPAARAARLAMIDGVRHWACDVVVMESGADDANAKLASLNNAERFRMAHGQIV